MSQATRRPSIPGGRRHRTAMAHRHGAPPSAVRATHISDVVAVGLRPSFPKATSGNISALV